MRGWNGGYWKAKRMTERIVQINKNQDMKKYKDIDRLIKAGIVINVDIDFDIDMDIDRYR
tara:strand:- start:1041 stop:1220 length:180 start_codon:yes stop_codon:yes gene_type:complete